MSAARSAPGSDAMGAPVEVRRPAAPVMPSACETGGCGGEAAPAAQAKGSRVQSVALVRKKAGPRSVDVDRVVVNGVEITAEAIAQEAQQHPAPDGKAAWLAAARALAMRELLLQEARRLGIEAEPETDEAGRRELDEEALIRALLEREAAPLAPTEDECRRYYAANAGRFRTPDLFEAAHILLEPDADDEAGWRAAESEARTIAREIGDDREAFAEAARAFSKCPSAQQGGSLGQVRRGELVPVVQAAIEALPEGVTGADPVCSRFGWHVLRLDRRIEGRTLPFEIVQARIADFLEARSWAVCAARYVALLAERADIEGVAIDPSVLDMEATR